MSFDLLTFSTMTIVILWILSFFVPHNSLNSKVKYVRYIAAYKGGGGECVCGGGRGAGGGGRGEGGWGRKSSSEDD